MKEEEIECAMAEKPVLLSMNVNENISREHHRNQTTGKSLKLIYFCLLVAVSVCNTAIFKVSQKNGEYKYNTLSAMTVVEGLKLIMSLGQCLYADGGNVHVCFRSFQRIPSVLYRVYTLLGLSYAVYNQLIFACLKEIDPGTFSLFKSLIPAVVALINWISFQKPLSKSQMFCVTIQMLGIVPVVMTTNMEGGNVFTISSHSFLIMISLIFHGSCNTVFNAALVKKESETVPLRLQNSVLYASGFVTNFFLYFATKQKQSGNFFFGYKNMGVIMLLFLNSAAGIIISCLYKHGDAVLKTLAQPLSSSLLVFISHLFFDMPMDVVKASGAGVVIISTLLYLDLPSQDVTKNDFAFCRRQHHSNVSHVHRDIGRFSPRRSSSLLLLCISLPSVYLIKSEPGMNRFISIGKSFTVDKRGRVEHKFNTSSERIRTFSKNSFASFENIAQDNINETMCERWGVVMANLKPSSGVARIALLASWCLVVVPDSRTPKHYIDELYNILLESNPMMSLEEFNKKVIFFSSEKIREWESAPGPRGTFSRSLPLNRFSRKNLGYLYAISHGANFIFDFDSYNTIDLDHNGMPLDPLPDGIDSSQIKVSNVTVVMQGSTSFNYHELLGASQNTSWPRGFPLDIIKDKNTRGLIAYHESELALKSKTSNIGVIQYVVNNAPDVDSFYHLTNPYPLTFQYAHSLLVPLHSYSPYNSQSTIHMKDAFWAMLLPSTLHEGISDVWRSYFAQCIFADAGLRILISPPKLSASIREKEYDDEMDLYKNTRQLIDFLSAWDSQANTIPKRMQDLWVDLYEHGYIEIDDVYLMQKWIESLLQVGYQFPPLKRRHRNVVIMGQFNYADKGETTIRDVIFWTQKTRERFQTVIAAGPFSSSQLKRFQQNSIKALSNEIGPLRSNWVVNGWYSPLDNLRRVLLMYKDSPYVKGVMYVHDDGLVNFTEITQGIYPFPTDAIVLTPFNFFGKGLDYQRGRLILTPYNSSNEGLELNPYNLDIRAASKTFAKDELKKLKRLTYRMFPDGHVETIDKKESFDSFDAMDKSLNLSTSWPSYKKDYCSGNQMALTKDPNSTNYQDEDGSILFLPFSQSDFMFVPTTCANVFAEAARLFVEHRIFLECAFPTVVDIVQRKTNISVRAISLCTDFRREFRGSPEFLETCLHSDQAVGMIHPVKLTATTGPVAGYKGYSDAHDQLVEV